MFDTLIIHYAEIGIKGENRSYFEKILVNNVKRVLGAAAKSVYKIYGRIICKLNKKPSIEVIKEKLGRVPGIAFFSFALQSKLETENIKKAALQLLKGLSFSTFKVDSKRSNKSFIKTSQELNELIGEAVVEEFGSKVKLKNPDITLFIEVCEKHAFLYTEKTGGVGGLPVGTGGRAVCLLSGGIDSPVASYLMMKRGCRIIFVHTSNKTITSRSVLSKIDKLVMQLTKYQLDSKIYIVPFENIQKEIISRVDSKIRMIIYRRFMTRIANAVAEKEKAKAVVTGDSIGQVASQTIENLKIIYEASQLPVLPPLIGMNKEEIIQLARKIGTYDYSILPYPDCCSFMIAQHPETKAKLENIIKAEKNIKNTDKLVKEAVNKSEVKIIKL